MERSIDPNYLLSRTLLFFTSDIFFCIIIFILTALMNVKTWLVIEKDVEIRDTLCRGFFRANSGKLNPI